MGRTLVLMRHAKSDWSTDADDRDRPLAPRGRRQAPAMGDWLATEGIVPDHVMVSPATRALQTWELVVKAMVSRGGTRPQVVVLDEAIYTFSGDVLFERVRRLPSGARTVVLVGHNPALDELIEMLTGKSTWLRTSSVAVIDVPGDWAEIGRRGRSSVPGGPHLVVAGRPADGPLRRRPIVD